MHTAISQRRSRCSKTKTESQRQSEDREKVKVELDMGEESRWQGFKMNGCR
jgi:hypothetical protein